MAKFISLFAGVGGFDLGMEQAGHECVAQVEWDKNAAGVLKHRWPNVPLFCDVSKVSADDLPDADFITYGFPCQDLSVAGKRKGLDGKRSGLFWEATRIIEQLAERAIRRGGAGGGRFIAVAENVKGLLSSGDGYDFARCIRELHNIGASEVGWSVLDSQFFGVPQRRKRVFLVADFGGESTSEILAFSEGMSGHPPPSRKAGEGTARDATKSVGEGGKCDCDPNGTAGTLLARDYKGLGNQDLETGRGLALQAQSTGSDPDLMATLCAKDNDKIGSNQWVKEGKAIIEQKETYCLQGGGETSQSSQGSGVNKDVSFTLNGLDKHGVAYEDKKSMSFAPSDITRGFGQKPEVELSGTLKKNHNDNSPHVVVGSLDCDERGPNLQSACSGHYIPVQGGEGVGVAFTASDRSNKAAWEGDISGTINCQMNSESSNLQMGVRENLTVRRLTPIECERLQGFPDNWTSEKMELTLEGNEWKATGKVLKQADGPRYKAMGNAVTVNVAEWIGKQIGKVLNENNI